MAEPPMVSDFLVAYLKTCGVKRLFGYSGDGINGIPGALDRAGNDPEFFQVRHAETTALIACAHAKNTGDAGVCLATQGPGTMHLLNGLYDARLDRQPVVQFVGQGSRMSYGSHFQQEVALPTLFKDVAGAIAGSSKTLRRCGIFSIGHFAWRLPSERRLVLELELNSPIAF